jgi:predicted MPP superfamily phosphohydrolase
VEISPLADRPETPERGLAERINLEYRKHYQMLLAEVMHKLRRDRFHEKDFQVDTLEVNVPGLDPLFEGYRIVQITDIHLGHWVSPERLAGVVDMVNQLEADVVAITGDFVSYVFDPLRDAMIESFSRIQSKDANLAILGNHDHWLGAHLVRDVLRESGVIELANDVYTIERQGARLYIAGVDDIMMKADRLDLVLEKLPADGPALLLAHEPDFADTSAETGRFFLQLSGHSHGGQIVWPGFGPLIRGPYFFKYPLGLYNVNGMLQYTNRGIGTHVFRMRINCPPEITLIILHPKTD